MRPNWVSPTPSELTSDLDIANNINDGDNDHAWNYDGHAIALVHSPQHDGKTAPQQRHFNPYSDNSGTILAIAGQDFAVIAGDTHQTAGYEI